MTTCFALMLPLCIRPRQSVSMLLPRAYVNKLPSLDKFAKALMYCRNYPRKTGSRMACWRRCAKVRRVNLSVKVVHHLHGDLNVVTEDAFEVVFSLTHMPFRRELFLWALNQKRPKCLTTYMKWFMYGRLMLHYVAGKESVRLNFKVNKTKQHC